MKIFMMSSSSLLLFISVAAQNVGIGTTTPPEKLSVLTTTSNYGMVHSDGTITVGTWVGNGGGYFGTKSAHPLRFFTANGSTQMTLLTNGNVGIGTSTPVSKLTIATPNNSDGFMHVSDGGIIFKESVGGVSAAIGTSSNHTFRLFANNVSLINMDPAGNIGIGLTDQAYKMDIADRIRLRSGASGSAGIWFNNPANGGPIAFIGSKDVDMVGLYGNVSGWSFLVNTNLGTVSIGSQNPVAGYRLSVQGNQYINGLLYTTGDANINGDAIVTGNISSGGVVSGGNFQTGGWTITGAGSFFFISGGGMQMELNDGSIDTYTTSDRNAKKDIQPLPNVLEKVMKLSPAQYYYKTDLTSSQLSTGFIAQDVQKLFPFAVHSKTDPSGNTMLSVAYRHFEVIAIKAIQEQQDIISRQQAKMAQMEKRLSALEKMGQ